MTEHAKAKGLTGRHVLAIFVGAFGLIIGVNLFMAYSAVSTFPGIEVRNGYVASQGFDTRRAAQIALGWTAGVDYADGILSVRITDAAGNPVQASQVTVLAGRATSDRDDFAPELVFDGQQYSAPAQLSPGKWILHLRATSLDGEPFQQRLELFLAAS